MKKHDVNLWGSQKSMVLTFGITEKHGINLWGHRKAWY